MRTEKKPQISCTLLMNKGLWGGMVAHSTPKAGVEWGTQSLGCGTEGRSLPPHRYVFVRTLISLGAPLTLRRAWSSTCSK